jgi:CMP-N-acetylneuraminic acid synthetase
MAFIPGKTASVGLPGKMFKKIGENSLLEWTLLAAAKSKYIDEIIVSSSDDKVFEIFNNFASKNAAKDYRYIQRPVDLCSATSKTEEAIKHLFSNYPYYSDFDYFIMLQATSPARRNNLIDRCFDKMIESNADSLLTVSACTPFFWIDNCCNKDNKFKPTYNLINRPMRQELSEKDFYYHDNGNVYITKVSSFLKSKCRLSGKIEIFPTDKTESLQIDNIEDFVMMESLYNHHGRFV